MCTERREAPRDVKADGRRMLRRKDGIGDVIEMQSNGWGRRRAEKPGGCVITQIQDRFHVRHDAVLIRSGTDKRALPAANTESVFN